MATTRRALLAEPDPALRRILVQRLSSEGFELRPFESLQEAVATVDPSSVDVVITSTRPGDDQLLTLRDRCDVPLIVMLPRDTHTMDAVDVLDAGADDYVIKPFSPRELVARLHALLRRSHPGAMASTPLSFFDGALVINLAVREVMVRGVVVRLPAKEFDLLAFLAQSPRQVFSRAQLMSQVWGTDANVTTATVTEHVRRLRQRIEEDPKHPQWITTVWSVGYRFDA
jgi:DNA-binding response OmpR family regulator